MKSLNSPSSNEFVIVVDAFMLAAAKRKKKELNWRINEILSGLIIMFTWINLKSWQRSLRTIAPTEWSIARDFPSGDIKKAIDTGCWSWPTTVSDIETVNFHDIDLGNFIDRMNLIIFRAVINTTKPRSRQTKCHWHWL